MSVWPFGDNEPQAPTAEERAKLQATTLREALASKDLKAIEAALQGLQESNVDIGKLFKSDASLLRTMGSRIVRSNSLEGICTLLNTVSQIDEAILLEPNADKKTLAMEIAAFAKHYKLPEAKKAALVGELGNYSITLPDDTRYTGAAL